MRSIVDVRATRRREGLLKEHLSQMYQGGRFALQILDRLCERLTLLPVLKRKGHVQPFELGFEPGTAAL